MTAPTDPLFACRAKVLRAQEELERLGAEVDQFSSGFREGEAYSVTRDIDPQTRQEVHRFHVLNPIPKVSWGIEVGIITYLSRSALDNLIELLTIKHTGKPLTRSEFPIFENRADFWRIGNGQLPAPRSGQYKIRGIAPAAAKRVEELQPYKATNQLSDSILWVLHGLSNLDKHRAPAVVGLVGAVVGMQFRPGPPRVASTALGRLPFDEGTEFARFDPPLDGEPSMQVDAKFSLDIAFDGGPGDRREVTPALHEILRETAAILDDFAPFMA